MSIWDLLSILFAVASLSVLILGLAFLCHQWVAAGPLRELPSFRFDVLMLTRALTGRRPKNATSTSVFFQEFIKISKKYYREGICVSWMLRPYLLIYDESTMKIFANEAAVIDKFSKYEIFNDALQNSLLASNGELWKIHRKALNPAFALGVLKGYMHVFNEHGKVLADTFQSTGGKPTEDSLIMLKRCTFSIITASVFDLNMKDEMFESRIENFITVVDKITEHFVYKLTRPWVNWRLFSPYFSAEKKYKEVIKTIRNYIDEIIDDLIQTITASKTQGKYPDDEMEVRKTLPRILIEYHLRDSTFTRDHLRDNFIAIMAAGYDTISYTLMWCLYSLGHHPEIQKEVLDEIESVVGSKDVTYDDLGNLKYLDCVIKESLRLYTTVPAFGRKLSKDIRYGKHTIPKGTEIAFLPYLLHQNPNIYEEPTKFKPERFADSSTIRPWTYFPFAEGHRNCIGKKFAMMEMKVLLVHVLRQFHVKSLDTVGDEDLDYAIVLKTTKPLRMLFESRRIGL